MSSPRSNVVTLANPDFADPVVARVPFFYGWVMLPIAIAGQVMTSPGQTYGISVFNDSFRQDLGLSHTALAGAYMAGTLLAALPVSYVGALMDRHGIRRVMSIVVVLFGGACIATSQVTGLFTLFVAFLMLRMLGQGALSLLSSNTVSMWFHDRLGTASGVMCVGAALAFAVVPRINLYLIDEFGWRWAYAMLGVAVWIVMLPLLALFFRNRPEDVGQLPDGILAARPRAAVAGADEGSIDEFTWGMTLKEALRTRTYWILLAMHMTWAMVGTAIVFHIVSLFEHQGLGRSEVAEFFTYFALSMAISQFIGGVLADRVVLNVLLLFSMIGMTLSVAYLPFVDSRLGVVVFAATSGFSQGLFIVLGQTVWARYYGRTHLGEIRGTIWTSCVAGSSVGPFIMGVAKDRLGSYWPAIWLFVGIYFLLALSALFVGPVQRKSNSGMTDRK